MLTWLCNRKILEEFILKPQRGDLMVAGLVCLRTPGNVTALNTSPGTGDRKKFKFAYSLKMCYITDELIIKNEHKN